MNINRFLLFTALFSLSLLQSLAQGTHPEGTVIGSLPGGLYYQTGPGGSNVSGGYHWTYPYGTKLTINAGASRNLEIMSTGKTADGLVYRQWSEGATWTGWRTILSTNNQGRVGLGLTVPNAQMDIFSTSSHALRLSTNNHSNDQKVEFHSGSGTYHSIVSNAGTGNLQLRAGDGGTGHEVLFFTDGAGRAGVSHLGGLAVGNSYFDNYTPANRLVVEGDIGIGTKTPSGQLELYSTSSHALRLATSNHVNDQKIEFHAGSGTYHSIISNAGSGNLQIRAGDGGSGHEVLFFTDGIGRAGVSHTGGLGIGNSYFNQPVAANRLAVEGDVGIGTKTPSGQLDIVKTGSVRLNVETQGSGTRYGEIAFKDNGSVVGFVWSVPGSNLLSMGKGGHQHINLRMDTENVGIGTTSPSQKLEVNGNVLVQGDVLSKKVKVSANPGDWPDYVFANDYHLRSLAEVSAFIEANHHLPEVPSAREVGENGLDLGSMDATLLKKIEELTLYTLDQEEKLKHQAEALKAQQEENDQLKQLLSELLKRVEKLEKQ